MLQGASDGGLSDLVASSGRARGATVSRQVMPDGDLLLALVPGGDGAFGVTFRGGAHSGFLWVDLPNADQVGPFEVDHRDGDDIARIVEDALGGGLVVTLRRGVRGFYPRFIEVGDVLWVLDRGVVDRLQHRYANRGLVSGERP